MRIALLTLPFNLNYGGFLQSFALMSVLKRMGHEPELIMRRHNKAKVSLKYKLKYFIKGILKLILRKKKIPIFYNVENNYLYRGKKMLAFVDKYITPQSKFLYNTRDLKDYCRDRFDAYIVGSDQIWRPDYVNGTLYNLFLDFTKGWDVKRIAYAASFGTDTPSYTKEQIKTSGLLASAFNAISLRERSGESVIHRFRWNVPNLKIVLDPTMLLSKDDYLNFTKQETTSLKGKIFSYLLDKTSNKEMLEQKLSEVLGKENYSFNIHSEIKPSIEQWLSCFRDCEYVLTDSYHGTVFAIIFNKPFFVIVNSERGANRFYDLLGQFHLQDRIVHEDDFNIKAIKKIEWHKVNMILQALKLESYNFLRNSL